MTETMVKLAELLGHSCQAGSTEESPPAKEEVDDRKHLRDVFHETPAEGRQCNDTSRFPSFSLDHVSHLKRDDAQSKEEVQMLASALLSQSVDIDVIENSTELEFIPRMMLENVYSSFDTLVDARVLAYSKILGNHSRTLAESHREDSDEDYSGTRVLEYKLKTLLEIGTSIYADSVITTFTPGKDHRIEEKDGFTEITTPITMNVEIRDLHMPCADSGSSANLRLCFNAAGTLQGE
jgi:hypothetical protein